MDGAFVARRDALDVYNAVLKVGRKLISLGEFVKVYINNRQIAKFCQPSAAAVRHPIDDNAWNKTLQSDGRFDMLKGVDRRRQCGNIPEPEQFADYFAFAARGRRSPCGFAQHHVASVCLSI